ncbi:hypothetical protein [Deinococcus sp. Leaf326]|uniref:hypothetical protein n=1 Tax=Deinococcus sp. Leaf326 TaxID=1736338 RepID=UPI0006FE7F39|nr:hypothetical protein [Deinococcus sp. Leaf326]KQR35976.1 hypothetical protein ASF71_15620 [Deinococcus sp. Leaf326]
MSFVRKPRPYSSGLPTLPNLPVSAPKPERERRPARPRTVPRPDPRARAPRSAWATAVTALAVLGTVTILLVGVSGLATQLWQAAQFRSAAVGVADVVR